MVSASSFVVEVCSVCGWYKKCPYVIFSAETACKCGAVESDWAQKAALSILHKAEAERDRLADEESQRGRMLELKKVKRKTNDHVVPVIEPLETVEWSSDLYDYVAVPSEQGGLLLEFMRKHLLKP